MNNKKQIIVGRYYNGFQNESYDVANFDLDTLRGLPFYYDESLIYFSLVERNKTKKTIFTKYILPPENYYNLISTDNPNPLSMESIGFDLKDLPKSLHATDIITFDPEYTYNLELEKTDNFDKLEKAFLTFLVEMLPSIKGLELKDTISIIDMNPFDFQAYNRFTSYEIYRFLKAFEHKNPNLKSLTQNYREYIMYKALINSINQEETSTNSRKA